MSLRGRYSLNRAAGHLQTHPVGLGNHLDTCVHQHCSHLSHFIRLQVNLNVPGGYESKIRLGGIIIERSPEEQHEEHSELLPDSRNKVQRKKTNIETKY